MSSRVVKCGVERSKGLVSTILDQGRLICTNCGTVVSDTYQTDTVHHKFYEYIGAFCPVDKAIHYRWISADWSISDTPEIRPREDDEPLILPKTTEMGAEKYFKKSYYWNSDSSDGEDYCYDPGYQEVVWSDFDDSKFVLLRPTDTGYLKVNSQGIHTPFIAALIEWLLKKEKWNDVAELANQSIIIDREKKVIQKAVSQPTPTNILKFLWTMKRYIPGWNSKRSLGKRSPSMLIIDEIRWTTNRLEDMDQVDRDRLLRYGPEPQYWNSWPGLWPKDVELGETLGDFGPEMKRLGIEYSNTLELITDPEIKQGERSWMQIADKMIQWPINVNKGGVVNQQLSQRSDRGFVANLMNNLKVAIEQKTDSDEWEDYLTLNLPLIWKNNGSKHHYSTEISLLTREDLQNTLQTLKPWVTKESNSEVVLEIEGELSDEYSYLLTSFRKRLKDTPIKIEHE